MLQHQINFTSTRADNSCPIILVRQKNCADLSFDTSTTKWMKVNNFTGKAGQILFVPHETGQLKKFYLESVMVKNLLSQDFSPNISLPDIGIYKDQLQTK